MRKFPISLNVSNKSEFPDLFYSRIKCYLRRDIFEHIISSKEEDYFSLDHINQRVKNIEMIKKIILELIPELEELGWKCKLSFGGTGLFIYSTEDPPSNCWD